MCTANLLVVFIEKNAVALPEYHFIEHICLFSNTPTYTTQNTYIYTVAMNT
jgi:hypothetical protein